MKSEEEIEVSIDEYGSAAESGDDYSIGWIAALKWCLE